MERDIERLLAGTTPSTGPPDVKTLHRRGVRRRLRVRVSAATVVVAVAAVGALAAQGLLPPGAIELGPADQVGGDDNAEGSPADGDGRADGTAAESRATEGGEAEPPFGLSPDDIEAAAAVLPDKGVEPASEDIETIRGTDLGEDPDLGVSHVGCLFPPGSGEVADPPEGARDRGEWYGGEATTDDLIAGCLEDEWLDSVGDHAPGPFTVCQEALTPEARREVIDQHARRGWAVASPGGNAGGYEPVAFPAVLAWEADCAHAGHRSDWGESTLDALPSLDAYNDRRRVEAAVKARERDCLSYPQALALGVAAAERLDGDWRLLAQHPDVPPRARPCAGLDFNPLWGTVIAMQEAYWGRQIAVPRALEADDARRVGSLGETLMEALEAGDAEGMADAVEQVADLEGHTPPPGSLGAGRASQYREDLSPEVVSIVSSALRLGCLEEPSAVTLALSLHDLLTVNDDADWFVGAVAVEDITDSDLEQPEPTCFRVSVTSTASFSDGRDPDPAIVVQPLWLD